MGGVEWVFPILRLMSRQLHTGENAIFPRVTTRKNGVLPPCESIWTPVYSEKPTLPRPCFGTKCKATVKTWLLERVSFAFNYFHFATPCILQEVEYGHWLMHLRFMSKRASVQILERTLLSV